MNLLSIFVSGDSTPFKIAVDDDALDTFENEDFSGLVAVSASTEVDFKAVFLGGTIQAYTVRDLPKEAHL